MCFRRLAKTPCGVGLKGVGTNSIFCGGCSSWIHKKCNGIPDHLKTDASFRCKRCTGQARPIAGRLMVEVTVGRERLDVVPPSVTLGTAYPQVVVVNSLLAQNAMSHGENSTSSCPSSPPAQFPSRPEEEFEIFVSWVPCSMQANLVPPTLSHLHRLQRDDQGPSQLAGSLGEDAAWRSGKGTQHPPTQMARSCRMQRWLVEESPETQSHRRSWLWSP